MKRRMRCQVRCVKKSWVILCSASLFPSADKCDLARIYARFAEVRHKIRMRSASSFLCTRAFLGAQEFGACPARKRKLCGDISCYMHCGTVELPQSSSMQPESCVARHPSQFGC